MIDIVSTVSTIVSCSMQCIICAIGYQVNNNLRIEAFQKRLQEAIEHADTIKDQFNDVNDNIDDVMRKYINLVNFKSGHPHNHDIYVAKININWFLDDFAYRVCDSSYASNLWFVTSFENRYIPETYINQVRNQIVYISSVVEPLNWVWHHFDIRNNEDSLRRNPRHTLISNMFDNGHTFPRLYREFLDIVLNDAGDMYKPLQSVGSNLRKAMIATFLHKH